MEPVNFGVGHDVTIAEFARTVADVVGYRGETGYDPSKPNSMPRKLVDVSMLTHLGWTARTVLRDGLERAYADFLGTQMGTISTGPTPPKPA